MNSREKKRPTAQPVLDRFPLSGREYYALRELFGVVSTFKTVLANSTSGFGAFRELTATIA